VVSFRSSISRFRPAPPDSGRGVEKRTGIRPAASAGSRSRGTDKSQAKNTASGGSDSPPVSARAMIASGSADEAPMATPAVHGRPREASREFQGASGIGMSPPVAPAIRTFDRHHRGADHRPAPQPSQSSSEAGGPTCHAASGSPQASRRGGTEAISIRVRDYEVSSFSCSSSCSCSSTGSISTSILTVPAFSKVKVMSKCSPCSKDLCTLSSSIHTTPGLSVST
jgi:hypothetical protein